MIFGPAPPLFELNQPFEMIQPPMNTEERRAAKP